MTTPTPRLYQVLFPVMILPFNVLVVIPVFMYHFSDKELLSLPAGLSRLFVLCAGSFLLIAGLMLLSRTIFLFYKKGKGSLAPWHPTRQLVVEGPYRYVRNPMISGVLCVLFAESLLTNSFYIFCWALLFFVINYVYFIFAEEPGLYKRFGEEYKIYKNNVPRWIPRRTPWKKK